jgi:hypothetical protein
VHLSVDAVGKRAIITGIVQNDNAFVLHKVTLNGVLSDKANEILGVSKTVVQDLTPKEERFFQIVIPLATLPAGPEALNPRIFIEAER